MDKEEKKPNLFDQALAIAIKEGKAESSKDAAPSQSGVIGENYLLYSKERKLLISIPLERLKRNPRKVSNTGKGSNGCLRYLGWFVFGSAFLAVLSAISIPKFPKITQREISAAAGYTLATMVKECAAKIATMGSGTVIVPELQGYKPKKKNIAGFYVGKNRKLSGTSIVCPTTGEMKVVSEDESEYPTYSYNFETGKKSCTADSGSTAEKRSCINGEW